jgi:hypothetical protein
MKKLAFLLLALPLAACAMPPEQHAQQANPVCLNNGVVASCAPAGQSLSNLDKGDVRVPGSIQP